MPYLKPNVPYEDNRTREEVLKYAFEALRRNHAHFHDYDQGRRAFSSAPSTAAHDGEEIGDDFEDLTNVIRASKSEETNWRVYATSDVHSDMQVNRDWVTRTCDNCVEPERRSILIVAGDVATDVNKVCEALRLFKKKYEEVFYCVGNHELWSPGRGEMGDSVDKFVNIINKVTEIGVRCTPAIFTSQGTNELGMKKENRVIVAPMLSWYTETFKGGTRPFTQMEVHFDGACIWPPAIGDPKDKRNSHPATLDEFWRSLGKLSLDSFLPKKFRNDEVSFLVTFGHFVPLPDLYNGTPFIEKVVGSESLGEDVIKLRDECDCKATPGSGRSSPAGFKKGRFDFTSATKHVHVFGHSHLNVDVELDGSRWYQKAIGYPNDRGPMPPHPPAQIYP